MAQRLAEPTVPVRRPPIHVGPADAGRRMSLDTFDESIGQEGFFYELNKGTVEVTNIPGRRHMVQTLAMRDQLVVYKSTHPGVITAVAGSFDSKLLIADHDSERHPDIAVHLSPMPDVDEIWSVWVPAIVVEVVSDGSARREYEEKPPEYLAFGVQECWIVDGFQQQMTAKTRYRGRWRDRVVKPTDDPYTTRHLPGFALDLKAVLAVG